MLLAGKASVSAVRTTRHSCHVHRSAARPSTVRSSKRIVVVANHPHGHGHGAPASRTNTVEKSEKEKGFINEMRMVAMKLHTKEQAPKEGQKEAPKQQGPWAPTREGYLRFLVESKAVYDVLEKAVQDSKHPEYAAFKSTGLERSHALAEDVKWFEQTYGLKAQPKEDGPGLTYAKKIAELADSDPPAFICHYYNFYFAHTAGGRMIGNKVAEMILDKQQLNFYKWDGDVNVSLDAVRRKINEMAEGWSREQKDHCLAETETSFKYSGVILRCITEAA